MDAKGASRSRARWGWWAAVAVVAAGFGLARLLGGGASAPRPRPGKPVFRMSDGTVLALEAVTYGKEHRHESGLVPWGRLREFLPLLPVASSFRHTTRQDALVCWLSRRDPISGQALGFDWWSHSTAFDEHGCRFDDTARRAEARARNGSGGASVYGRGAPRVTLPGMTAVVGLTEMEAFPRRGKSFRLGLYDPRGRRAAEFVVPNPDPGPHPEWAPEPLPVARRDGDLTFTLTELARRESRFPLSGGAWFTEYSLDSRFRILRGSRPTSEWEALDTTVHDATGNVSQSYPVRLCPYEPAWKLRVQFARTHRARFAPQETWSVRGVPVPGVGKVARLAGGSTRQGVTLQLVAIAGPGKVRYSRGVPEALSLSAAERRRILENKSLGGGGSDDQHDVSGGLAHVAVRVTGLTEDHRLTLRATDERGRQSVLASVMTLGGTQYLGLDLPSDARRVDLLFAVHQSRVVEFVVAPPRSKKGPDGPAEVGGA